MAPKNNDTPATRESPVVPGRVISATLAATIVPGAGHFLLRHAAWGGVFLLLIGAGAAAAALHLIQGLDLFESKLGAFCFAILLRGVIILHVYSVLDAYLRGVDPAGRAAATGRQALVLNLLVPGAGYLLARAWIRAITGLALLVLIIYFAQFGKHPYLDVIYVGMQVVMALAVYHQQRMKDAKEMEAAGTDPPRLPAVPAAQIILLLVVVAAVFACGYVVQLAMPNSASAGLTEKDIKTIKTGRGIAFSVPRLKMSITAAGKGWSVKERSAGFLFSAEHEDGPTLLVGVQQVQPFLKTERYMAKIQQWMEGNRLVHQKTRKITLNGAPAWQMEFSGDHWTIAVPRPGFAYVIMLGCRLPSCQGQRAIRLETRDSFKSK